MSALTDLEARLARTEDALADAQKRAHDMANRAQAAEMVLAEMIPALDDARARRQHIELMADARAVLAAAAAVTTPTGVSRG